MKSKKWMMIFVVAGLILGACTGPVVSTTQVPSLDEILSPEVAQDIQNRVSEILGTPIESLQIVQITPMEWPDSCLGLGGADESCLQAVTPGWLLVFSVNGEEFRFRVSQDGTALRQEP